MPDRISRLKIEGFRGATQPLDLEFDASKPVVLIFGENGSGKSTIVDAIESVGAGTTAFLNDWKLGKGKRKEGYIPTLGKTLKDVAISLDFGANTYTAKLGNRGLQLCSTKDRPITKVLRRKSLQAFMDADPAQRYKEVATFLDIPQIEASESTLREALKEAQRQFELATSAYSQAQESLQGLWEAEDSPGLNKKHTAEIWARQQAEIPTAQLQEKLATLKTSVKHCETLAAQAEAVNNAEQQLTQASQSLEVAEQQLKDIESGDSKGSGELVTLLQDAKTYLSKSNDTLCPVCEETTIVSEELVQRLELRIEGMNALKQASHDKTAAEKNVHAKQDQLVQSRNKLLDAGQSAQQHFYPDSPDDDDIEKLRLKDQEKAHAVVMQLNKQLVAERDKLQAELDSTQKQVNNLTSIKQTIKTLEEKSTEAKTKELLSKRLQQAVNIVEAKRKSYVEGILASIASDVDSLYQQIHPQEDIGQISLMLDDNKRGSLVYGVAFGGKQGMQPQPYYSESHLDTLGLCIFLALAKRGDSSRTLIVLDDVLGSVDQQHLQKTLDMLMAEANSFAQIIMTTHYRPLRDRFRFAQQAVAKVQLIELKPWNFVHGIKSGKTLSYAADLRLQLEAPELRRESVAGQAGILFENLLEFITQTYRCKVPHLIEPRYTFGELASAPNNKLKQALKVIKQDNGAPVETPLAPIYADLQQAIQIRNLVGSHFNQWAGELSDDEVKDMAELALKLADTLVCQHCGSLPVSNKSGSYWQCKCKQTQMHPLQQPQ